MNLEYLIVTSSTCSDCDISKYFCLQNRAAYAALAAHSQHQNMEDLDYTFLLMELYLLTIWPLY